MSRLSRNAFHGHSQHFLDFFFGKLLGLTTSKTILKAREALVFESLPPAVDSQCSGPELACHFLNCLSRSRQQDDLRTEYKALRCFR